MGTEDSRGNKPRKGNGAERFSDRNQSEENVLRCFTELLVGMRRQPESQRNFTNEKKKLDTSLGRGIIVIYTAGLSRKHYFSLHDPENTDKDLSKILT